MVEEMIFLGNYKGAMSAVLTRANGQPSFKDKQVKMFLPPVTEFLVEELAIMKMEGKQPSATT